MTHMQDRFFAEKIRIAATGKAGLSIFIVMKELIADLLKKALVKSWVVLF